MPRFNINGGSQLDIPETEPFLITAWLITNPPNPVGDAILSAIDADGDVFTVNGFRLKQADDVSGANINIRVDPTVTVMLVGAGAAATIYYERLTWSVNPQP